MQVNRSPSFGTDEQLDYDIKSAVVEDAIKMLNIKYVIVDLSLSEYVAWLCDFLLTLLSTIYKILFALFVTSTLWRMRNCLCFDAIRW